MLQHLRWFTLALLLAAMPTWAAAEQVRFHYVPIDACGRTAAVPFGPDGTVGELKRGRADGTHHESDHLQLQRLHRRGTLLGGRLR